MSSRPSELDLGRLRTEISVMVEALTHPAYVEAMRAVRSVPRERRLVEGARRLNPEALREAGVPLPQNMRISSRYFDDELSNSVDFGDASGRNVDLINALDTAQPAFLDQVRAENVELFEQIVRFDKGFVATAGCCCGGGATVCGGCGG